MVMSATSLSDVSLMAMVPDSECKMPTLIGPVSETLAAAGAAATADAAAGAALVAAAGAASPGPLHPTAASSPRSMSSNRLFITLLQSKTESWRHRLDTTGALHPLSSSVASFGLVSGLRLRGVVAHKCGFT